MEHSLKKYLFFVISGLVLSIQLASAATPTKEQETCKEFCPLHYQPICAFDGSEFVDYSNLCFFEVAKCEARNIANREPTRVPMEFCKKEDNNDIGILPVDASPRMTKEECGDMCITVYDPVCAFDGVMHVTYSNACMLGMAQCKARNDGTAQPMSVSMELCQIDK